MVNMRLPQELEIFQLMLLQLIIKIFHHLNFTKILPSNRARTTFLNTQLKPILKILESKYQDKLN
jgi:hypothetical protein